MTSPRRHPGSTESQTTEHRTARKQCSQNIDIEAIDLTGDYEVSLSPVRRFISTGTECKSDEYGQDLRHAMPPRPAWSVRSVPTFSPEVDSDGFVSINDVVMAPDTPPSPYLNVVGGRQRSAGRTAVAVGDDTVALMQLEHKVQSPIPTEPALSTQDRKLKFLSCIPSESSAPVRETGERTSSHPALKHQASVSGAAIMKAVRLDTFPTKRVDRAVLHPGDQRCNKLDEMNINPQSLTILSSPAQRKMLGKILISDAAPPDSDQTQLPLRAPAEDLRDTNSHRTKNDAISTSTQHQPPCEKPASPEKASPAPESPVAQYQPTSITSRTSKERRDIMREVVDSFLASEGQYLQHQLNAARSNWSNARDAFIVHLAEFGAPDPIEEEKLKCCRSRREAMEQLADLKSRYDNLAVQRQRLRNKIEKDLDLGQFDATDGEALNKSFQLLEDTQIQMCYLFDTAGIDQQTLTVINIGTKGITSNGISKQRKRTRNIDFDDLPQEQSLKGTRTEAERSILPSSRRVRFAEQQVDAPHAFPLDLQHRAQTGASVIEKYDSGLHERSLQMLERPRCHPGLVQTMPPAFHEPGDQTSLGEPAKFCGWELGEDKSDFSNKLSPLTDFVKATDRLEENYGVEDDEEFLRVISNIENEVRISKKTSGRKR
jgi:bloom syndrome protein